MKNQAQGTHNENICAEISTGKTPNTPQIVRPIIWDILEKKVFITCPLSMHLTKLSL
jgi:hypothetical protein